MSISRVKVIVNPSSIAGAYSSGMIESVLSGGPCTASTMLLAMMTKSVMPSNHFCSVSQIKPRRRRADGGSIPQHTRPV